MMNFLREEFLLENKKIIQIVGGSINKRSATGKYGYLCRAILFDERIVKLSSYRFDKKKEAVEAFNYLKKIVEDKKNNFVKKRNVGDFIFFEDVATEYLMDYNHGAKPSSQLKVKEVVTTHLIAYFLDTEINEISSKDIQKFKMFLDNKKNVNGKKIVSQTKNTILNRLNLIFDYAITMDYVKKNPCDNIRRFGKSHEVTKMNIWTSDQFQLFERNIDVFTDRVLFNILFYTGIRRGELLALQWKHINIKKQLIKIEQSCYRSMITTPKTKSSNRSILVPLFLIEMLKCLKSEHQAKLGFSDEIFIFGFDKPISATSLDYKNRKYAKLVDFERLNLHGYRHSHACYLLHELNVSVKLVAERLGHKDAYETLNTYVHTSSENEFQLIELMQQNKK